MSNYAGLFITVEGPNGVGKSSLVSGLMSELCELGINTLETSEPTESYLGQLVRQLEADYQGLVYACLIAADRYYHLEREVVPALQQGKVVLSTRYIESSLVLQRLDNVELEFIWAVNSQILIPDLSVILTAPAEILEQRLAERSSFSRFEESKTRAAELDYYLDAAEFISNRGFQVLLLDNGHTPLQKNIDTLSKKIATQLHREKE